MHEYVFSVRSRRWVVVEECFAGHAGLTKWSSHLWMEEDPD